MILLASVQKPGAWKQFVEGLATTYCVHAIEEQVQLVKVIGILGINVI